MTRNPQESLPHQTPDKTLKRRKLWFVLAACIAAIGLAAVGAWYLRSGRTAQIDSIAVLPFTNGGGDANTDYLSDGITESLIGNLAHVPQLKVKSRNSVFRYKGKDVDVQKVGNELGVSALVSGRVVPRGDSIEVSAELTDVRDNTEIWGQHYSGKSADIISLQQQIAGDIAEKLRSKLSTSEKQQVTKQGTQNPEAYELYLKGRYYVEQTNGCGHCRQQSPISIKPSPKTPATLWRIRVWPMPIAYCLTMVALPAKTIRSRMPPPARRWSWTRPWLVPMLFWATTRWSTSGILPEERLSSRRLSNSTPTTPRHTNGTRKKSAWIGGREQEALAETNRAHQLDPLSPIISADVGVVHIWARQYDEAIVICKKLANENPTFALAHHCLVHAYWGKRMYPQVIEEWKAYGKLSGDRNESEFASALEQGFRSAGWKGALTKGIETRQAQRKTGYSSAYGIAELYADLGDKDQAFRWLNTAYQERDCADGFED